MAVNLSPLGGVGAQFFDNSGNPLTGGKIYTYAAGTTTNQATYTSSSGSTAHSNPIILDAAGRVPGGEIWLTDGLQYKFVLKTSTDTSIATYDNIVGINSNFVNYTNQQEIQTATANQTVFTLATMTYQPGTGALSVFVDGVNQYGPGAQYAFVETDSTTVTFVSGLHVGASVKFTTSQVQNAGVADASQITYDPPYTGSVPTNVEAKLAQYVSVKDFGAVGDGVTDDTSAIQAAIDIGSSVFFPEGTYKTTATLTITNSSTVLHGSGKETTIIKPVGASITGITASSKNNLAIENLKIDMAGSTGTADGISWTNVSKSRICMVTVINATRAGLRLVSTGYGNTIDTCTFDSNLYGLDVQGAASNNLITTLLCNSMWTQSNTSHGINLKNAAHLTFNNCVTEFNGGSGLKLESYIDNLIWNGGTSEANTRYAIENDGVSYENIRIFGYYDVVSGLGLTSPSFVNLPVEITKGGLNSSSFNVGGANTVGFWQFDEGSGTTISDKSGNGYTMTFDANIQTLSPKISGQKQYINLTNGSHYCDTPDANAFSFGNGSTDSAFTIVALVNPANTADMWMAGKYSDAGGNKREYIFGSDGSSTLLIRLFDNSTGGYIGRAYSSAITADTGTWHVYAMTYSGSSTAAGCKLYRDGTRVDDFDSNSGSYTAMENLTAKFGTYIISSSTVVPFKGKYGYLAVFSSELTAAQIKQLTVELSASVGNRV